MRGSGRLGFCSVPSDLLYGAANMFAGECGHDFAVEIAFVAGCTGFAQEGKVVEADVAVARNLAGLERFLDFANTFFERITATEADALFNFAEVHAIVPAVGVFHPFDAREGKDGPNHIRYVGKRIVQPVVANIENLTAHGVQRRPEELQNGFGDIFHVDERAPLLAVENGDEPFLTGLGGQEIDYEIKAWPLREAENGRKAHEHRMKAVASGFKQRPLRSFLRFAV